MRDPSLANTPTTPTDKMHIYNVNMYVYVLCCGWSDDVAGGVAA